MQIPKKMSSALEAFSKDLLSHEKYLVVSHHDADGITSCAIICDLLKSIGKDTEFRCLKQIDSVTAGLIEDHQDRTLVLTDFGSGQHSILENHGITDYYVIDHHAPERHHPNQMNPHDFGIDGAKEISGAGMTYLVARAAGRTNMAHIAIVGAVGDMQDSRGRLESLNRLILEDAVKQGTVKVENDIRMFGRMSRSMPQMLAYSADPVIPGLTGDQQACAAFIESAKIKCQQNGAFRSYVELSTAEKQAFFSALYVKMIDSNIPQYALDSLLGEVYTLLREPFKSETADAKEYATVLNACGRQREPEIGVEVCLGKRGKTWKRAQSLLERHRASLRRGIEYLSANGTNNMESLNWFSADDNIDESIIGIIAGMAYGARIIPYDKPILAFAQDRDDTAFYKVSSRANWSLVRRGIHLGDAMRRCSALFGGEGGGHNIAAGARVPKKCRDEFLKCIQETFKSQTI